MSDHFGENVPVGRKYGEQDVVAMYYGDQEIPLGETHQFDLLVEHQQAGLEKYGFTALVGDITPGNLDGTVITEASHQFNLTGELTLQFAGDAQPAPTIIWRQAGVKAVMVANGTSYDGNNFDIANDLINNVDNTLSMSLELVP